VREDGVSLSLSLSLSEAFLGSIIGKPWIWEIMDVAMVRANSDADFVINDLTSV
jgi:hypothetical protein